MTTRKAMAAAISGSLLAGAALGLIIFGPSLANAQTSGTTAPPAATTSPSGPAGAGTFRSNEDPTHEATESPEREAAENSGQTFGGRHGSNEDPAHEAAESPEREAQENAQNPAGGGAPNSSTAPAPASGNSTLQ